MFLPQISVGANPDDGTGTPLRNGGLLLNESFARLAGSPWRLPVMAVSSSAPGSPTHLSRYLVSTTPTGAFSGCANAVAEWIGTPAGGAPINAWQFEMPEAGAILWVTSEQRFRRFDGSSWATFDGSSGAVTYLGTWNAATNSPPIPVAVPGNKGNYYKVSVAGTTIINGTSSWSIGDWIISDGASWDRVPVSSSVQSVFGLQGAVSLLSLPSRSVAETTDAIVIVDPETAQHYQMARSDFLAGIGSSGITSITFDGGLSPDNSTGAAGAVTATGTARLSIASTQTFGAGSLDETAKILLGKAGDIANRVYNLTLGGLIGQLTTSASASDLWRVPAWNGTNLRSIKRDDFLHKSLLQEVEMRGYVETVQAITVSTSQTLPAYEQGNVYEVTLSGNVTLTLPTPPAGGAAITVIIIQDATGARTLTFAPSSGTTFKVIGSSSLSAPSAAANKTSVYSFYRPSGRTYWLAESLGSES